MVSSEALAPVEHCTDKGCQTLTTFKAMGLVAVSITAKSNLHMQMQ
jgi:hypothetical protein